MQLAVCCLDGHTSGHGTSAPVAVVSAVSQAYSSSLFARPRLLISFAMRLALCNCPPGASVLRSEFGLVCLSELVRFVLSPREVTEHDKIWPLSISHKAFLRPGESLVARKPSTTNCLRIRLLNLRDDNRASGRLSINCSGRAAKY